MARVLGKIQQPKGRVLGKIEPQPGGRVLGRMEDSLKEIDLPPSDLVTQAAVGLVMPGFLPTFRNLPDAGKKELSDSLVQASVGLSDAFAFNLPQYALSQMGLKLPEPKTPTQRAARGLGELGGFVKGPINIAKKIVTKIPIVARAFTPASNMVQAVAKPIIRSASTLGTAQALTTPPGGFLSVEDRLKQAGEGIKTGGAYGALSFIPSKPLRMLATSGYTGIPSTLRNEPLEQQVFNYGLGAWFGREGASPKQILKTEKKALDTANRLISEGMDKPEKHLKQNDALLAQEEAISKSTGREPITRQQRFEEASRGRLRHFVPLVKNWKKNVIKEIKNKVVELRKNPSFMLETGDMDFLTEYIRKDLKFKSSELQKLSDAKLYNIVEKLRTYKVPDRTPFEETPPLKPIYAGRDWSKKINPWDRFLRPGLFKLQKMGLGRFPNEGLTGEFFESGVKKAEFADRYIAIKNNWLRTIGANKTRSNDVFNFLDGKVSEQYLRKTHGEKTVRTAHQMRRYFDTLLNQVNRYRAMYGEEPVNRRKNYVTHLFEDFVQEMGKNKQQMPDWLEDAMPFIVPEKKAFPFGIKRKGGEGFQKDIWTALDAYTTKAGQSLNDTPIRRANKVIKYLNKQIAYEKKTGDVSEIDLVGIKRNLDSYSRIIQGRPGSLDKTLRAVVDPINKLLSVVPGSPRIKSLGDVTDMGVSLIYGTQLGGRPKTGIRNLSQHSLIIGQSGFKPLLWALRPGDAVEKQNVLSKSRVLSGRKRAFAAESQALSGRNIIQKGIDKSMFLFKAADVRNVKSAFLAGYKQAKDNPKKWGDPIKRGDKVAALTQYLYMPENRSELANFWGLSRQLGRPLSMFTTWPANWIEFNIASAQPETRKNLLKYYATATVGTALLSTMGIKGAEYFGVTSLKSILDLMRAKVPITGIAEKPNIRILNELSKVLDGDSTLKELLFYTYRNEE